MLQRWVLRMWLVWQRKKLLRGRVPLVLHGPDFPYDARGQVVALCLLMPLVITPWALLRPSADRRLLRGYGGAARALGQGARGREAGAHGRLPGHVPGGGLYLYRHESEPSPGRPPCHAGDTAAGDPHEASSCTAAAANGTGVSVRDTDLRVDRFTDRERRAVSYSTSRLEVALICLTQLCGVLLWIDPWQLCVYDTRTASMAIRSGV